VYIVSSSTTEIIANNFKRHGVEFSLDNILGSDKGISKVDKINSVKDKVEGNFFYITDTTGDVMEVQPTGVKTIGVTWGYHPKDRLEASKPNYLVNSPQELSNLIHSL